MSESETKVIVGQCVEISERNGWTAFSINVGSQYPVKLSTKVAAIIEAARAVGSDTATWTFKESQGGENPNRPGTFYKNRYLDKVEAGDHAANGSPAPATASGTPLPEAHYDAIAPADKDRAITRMSCLSSAATLLQGVEFKDNGQRIVAWLTAAEAAERKVYRDISDQDDIPFDDSIPFGDE